MLSLPELSIVIPTFNTAAMTLACCRAAIGAAPSDSEVIVVDDGSTDGTSELLKAEAPQVEVIRLNANAGFACAANAGVAAARGRIVLLLNSDARIDPSAPSAFLEAFANDERLGIAGARLLNADGTPQWSGGTLPTLPWLLVMVSGIARFLPKRRPAPGGEVGWVSGAAMAFRRETWTAAGPLNESYRFYAQDLEFCARARDLGWQVAIVNSAHVVHDGGATLRSSREMAELPHDPALLWLDLFAWGRSHYGRHWSAIALPLMCSAAALRIAARKAREFFLKEERRRRERSVTSAYSNALRQLLVERQKISRQGVTGIARLDEPAAGIADRDRP